MAIDPATYRLFKIIDRQLREEYAAYLAACEADYALGYRAHYCEHGTNLYVDYDPMCGHCEEGRTMGDPGQRRRLALYRAKAQREQARKVAVWMREATELGVVGCVDMDKATTAYERLLGLV